MATYYIKNDGSDNYTGLSDSSAWQTISKINSFSFSPSDNILFKKGDTWPIIDPAGSDALYINHSGSEGSHIIYGSYGSGSQPILGGKNEISGWDTSSNWVNTSTNIWCWPSGYSVISSNTRGRLWLDGAEKQKYNSTTICDASYPWTHDISALYVYSIGNPTMYYTNIEGITVVFCVYLDKNYITIQDLDIRGGYNQVQFVGAHDIILQDCSIGRDCTASGLWIYANGSTYCTDGIIRNCTFDANDTFLDAYTFNNTEDGLLMTAGADNWDIYQNIWKNWSHTGCSIMPGYTDTPVTNIKVHHNKMTSPDIDYGRGLGFVGVANQYVGNEIYDNFIYDTPTMNQIVGSYINFYNNIIDEVRGTSYRADVAAAGLSLYCGSSPINYNKIYNNIFANTYDCGLEFRYSTTYSYYQNLIRNNIFYNNGHGGAAGEVGIYVEYLADCSCENTFENNLFYKAGVTNLIFYGQLIKAGIYDYGWQSFVTSASFNQYNGTENDVIHNNITGNPSFIDITNSNYLLRNYRLNSESSAVHTGVYITDISSFTDYDGSLWNNPPSIGAFEYSYDVSYSVPTVNTSSMTDISINTAIANGVVVHDGSISLTYRGFCVSTASSPTTLDVSSRDTSTGEGSFNLTLTSLSSSTHYFVRAFAYNSVGTAYGSDVSFNTLSETATPEPSLSYNHIYGYRLGSTMFRVNKNIITLRT